jgi:hypothetical protein
MCSTSAVTSFSAIGVVVIGACTVYVAWRQSETAKAQLKLDLFEKRYAIFEQTWKQLSEVVSNVGKGNLLPFPEFTNMLPQAGFLFCSEIQNYLNEISDKRSELTKLVMEIEAQSRPKDIAGEEKQPMKIKTNQSTPQENIIGKRTKLSKWFFDEASKGCKERFGPWLDFQKWK